MSHLKVVNLTGAPPLPAEYQGYKLQKAVVALPPTVVATWVGSKKKQEREDGHPLLPVQLAGRIPA